MDFNFIFSPLRFKIKVSQLVINVCLKCIPIYRVSDFLMGDVDAGSGLGIPQTRRSRVRLFLKIFYSHAFFNILVFELVP